jgi:hypothetical protein
MIFNITRIIVVVICFGYGTSQNAPFYLFQLMLGVIGKRIKGKAINKIYWPSKCFLT